MKKEPKIVKKDTKDIAYVLDLIDKANESIQTLTKRLDLTGKRTDTLSQGMDNVSVILDRVKNRMGL